MAEPPPDLSDRTLPLLQISADMAIYQCHSLRRGPLSFNPRSTGRFNAPNGEFGVVYASLTPEGAFVERFLQSDGLRYEHTAWPVLDRTTIDNHCLCQLDFADPATHSHLNVVDMLGPINHLGGDARLSSATEPTGITQRWSLAFWSHPIQPDGIIYRARHDNSQFSVALFDRAGHILTSNCTSNVLLNQSRLNGLLVRYSVGLVEV